MKRAKVKRQKSTGGEGTVGKVKKQKPKGGESTGSQKHSQVHKNENHLIDVTHEYISQTKVTDTRHSTDQHGKTDPEETENGGAPDDGNDAGVDTEIPVAPSMEQSEEVDDDRHRVEHSTIRRVVRKASGAGNLQGRRDESSSRHNREATSVCRHRSGDADSPANAESEKLDKEASDQNNHSTDGKTDGNKSDSGTGHDIKDRGSNNPGGGSRQPDYPRQTTRARKESEGLGDRGNRVTGRGSRDG